MFEKLVEQQCRRFAADGKIFNEKLHDENQEIFMQFRDTFPHYTIALAISLTWTKHAKYNPDFFEYAIPFLESNKEIDPNMVGHFAQRFGETSLRKALLGLRRFREEIEKIVPDFGACDAKAIKKFQNKSLSILDSLKTKRIVSGVGPWLFLGPFKIILGTEKRVWEDPNMDSVILPTGIEVNKGIAKLIKQESVLVKDFDPKWIVNEEQSLLEGFSNDQLVHNALKGIADKANSRVLHINSALYLYGSKNLG